ncbi:hypothetical protein [Mangrovibacillus cuniculi]|uniref:Uncharacterized protein n=1 Tax=Mangrovibacillus cuniculi TaxID=2593652 RepID=A0A7S8CBN6_9BACI|nr:hypothetical protein [Mangrovibacillus cuniculi]QPC47010.1 hypothetical protein G8O30_08560 [Mangrovibacillus cuniculi]
MRHGFQHGLAMSSKWQDGKGSKVMTEEATSALWSPFGVQMEDRKNVQKNMLKR